MSSPPAAPPYVTEAIAAARAAPWPAVAERTRAALGRYARELHDEGERPEQMLVRVKLLIRELPDGPRGALISWCIGAFYGDSRDA